MIVEAQIDVGGHEPLKKLRIILLLQFIIHFLMIVAAIGGGLVFVLRARLEQIFERHGSLSNHLGSGHHLLCACSDNEAHEEGDEYEPRNDSNAESRSAKF